MNNNADFDKLDPKERQKIYNELESLKIRIHSLKDTIYYLEENLDYQKRILANKEKLFKILMEKYNISEI